MYAFFESILRVTAWPMTPPAPYSAFHILLTLFGDRDHDGGTGNGDRDPADFDAGTF